MHIYLIGYILIPLGLLFFFISPRRLYELFIFSIPFTATALFNITGLGFSIEGISAATVLGGLCMVRYAVTLITKEKVRITTRKALLLGLIVILCICAVVSLIMPAIINGKLKVLDAYSNTVMYADEIPLYFKFQYVTQVAYFVFNALIACFIALRNDTDERLQRTVQIFVNGCLFISLWGLLEIVLYHVNLPYPAFLFNTNTGSMNHDGPSMMEDGTVRLVSAAMEASIFSQTLLVALPLLFWPIHLGHSNKSLRIKLYMLLIFIALLFTKSATAAVGLAAFFGLVFMSSITRRKLKWYIVLILGGGIITAIALTPILFVKVIEKLQTFSGVERLIAVENAWRYFTSYPILGIGWGVSPSWDFILCVLAGMGVIGLFFFLILFYNIFNQYRQLDTAGNNTVLKSSIFYSFLMLLVVTQFSGFLYYLMYFWLILGLTVASVSNMDSPNKSIA